MPLSPKLIAGHKAVTELLAGKDVRIKDPDQSAMEFAALTSTHSVSVACWSSDVVVTWTGANALEYDTTTVRYPVSHEDPEFTSKLGEVLLPVVEKYLSRVAQAAR